MIAKSAELVYKLQHLFDPSRVIQAHHDRLRPFKLREELTESDLLPLVDADDKEFKVEAVLGHVGVNKKNVFFLIRWEGFAGSSDTYEPWKNVQGNVLVTQYIRAHPELSNLLK